MSGGTQIEHELALLDLEERQLLIERKKIELDRKRLEFKRRLQAITTQNPVDLTVDIISCEVKQRHGQVADEGTYSPELYVQQLLILEQEKVL